MNANGIDPRLVADLIGQLGNYQNPMVLKQVAQLLATAANGEDVTTIMQGMPVKLPALEAIVRQMTARTAAEQDDAAAFDDQLRSVYRGNQPRGMAPTFQPANPMARALKI